MAFGVETHKAFVNTWECDENVHLNVQFYWKRFGDAGRIFSHLAKISTGRWTNRHVRYHRELGMSARTLVRSAALADGSSIVHMMENGENGTIAATAVDQFESAIGKCAVQVDELPEAAHPRSLTTKRLDIVDTRHVIGQGRGVVSLRSVVHPEECDSRGLMLDQHHISRFSDAAAHFWGFMGVDRKWMVDNGLGSVAVEMQATRHRPVTNGMLLEIASWLDTVGDKAFTFRHQVTDMERDEVVYSGAVTAMLIDMNTRKLAHLPGIILKWR